MSDDENSSLISRGSIQHGPSTSNGATGAGVVGYGSRNYQSITQDDTNDPTRPTTKPGIKDTDPQFEEVTICCCTYYYRWIYAFPTTLFLNLFCIGVMYAISEYTHYINEVRKGWEEMGIVSIGLALQAGITGIVAVYVGAQLNETPARLYFILGSVVMGLGQAFMGLGIHISYFTNPATYLCGAVLTGIGNGMLVITALQHLLAWFQSHAVVMSGVNGMFIGFGAMINSAIIPNVSKSRIGPHGALYMYAVIYIFIMGPVLSYARFPNKKPSHFNLPPRRSLSRFQILKTYQFWLYFLGLFASLMCGWAMEPQLVNIFSCLTGVGNDYYGLVLAIHFFYTIGRVVAGAFASRFGTKLTYVIILSVQAFCFVLVLCLTGIVNFYVLYIFLCIAFIMFGGAKVLINPVSREFFGIDNLNVAVGMNFTGASAASILGPVLSSQLVKSASLPGVSGELYMYDTLFVLMTAVNIVGLIAVMFLKPLRQIDDEFDPTSSIIVVAEDEVLR